MLPRPSLFAWNADTDPPIKTFEAVAVFDDDMVVSVPSLNRLFELRREHQVTIIFPAKSARDGHTSCTHDHHHQQRRFTYLLT